MSTDREDTQEHWPNTVLYVSETWVTIPLLFQSYMNEELPCPCPGCALNGLGMPNSSVRAISVVYIFNYANVDAKPLSSQTE